MQRSACCRKHDLSPPSAMIAAHMQLVTLSFLSPIQRLMQPIDAPVAINLVGPLKCFAGQNQSVCYRPHSSHSKSGSRVAMGGPSLRLRLPLHHSREETIRIVAGGRQRQVIRMG